MLAKCLLSGIDAKEIKIFYSYAHKDAEHRSLVEDVLGRFKWDVAVRAWYDGDIRPGDEWSDQIYRHLDAADILLLFITQGFVESQYCMEVELPRAMIRHKNKEARVIPIVFEPTNPDWRTLPFGKLQVLPLNGMPLSQWKDNSQAMREIVQELVNLIAEPFVESTERIRWKLYLDTDFFSFSLKDEAEVINSLRDISGDSTLRSRGVAASGSVVLDMDSTRDGFVRVRHWFESGNCRARRQLIFTVLSIIEWYGAGVNAGATTEMPSHPRPARVDQLQFPSAPGIGIMIRAIKVDAHDPLKFQNIFDTGNWKGTEQAFSSECQVMIKDFLALIATPEEDMWVNLSPNDSAKLLGVTLKGTHVGRMLLEYDLLLKRLASSLLHPDHECGRKYWNRVFSVAKHDTGTTDHVFRTHPRLWMVPRKATVYHREGPCEGDPDHMILVPLSASEHQAFVVEQNIEIMCEQDYFEAKTDQSHFDTRIDEICHEAFVDIVLPIVQKEVSTGHAFAGFRQIYNSMILATWLKIEFRDNPIIGKYIDSRNPGQLEPTILNTTPISRQDSLDESTHTGQRDDQGANNPAECHEVDELDVAFNEGVRLREQGDLLKSKELLSKVTNNRLRDKGESHYLTHIAMSQLGRTHRALKEFDCAEELHRKVLKIRERLLGPKHEYTINSMRILADTLSSSGQIVEAAQLITDAAAAEVTLKPEYHDPDNREFYDRYLEIYRNGIFHIQRHEFEPSAGKRITRTYFAGALDFRGLGKVIKTIRK